MAEIVAFLGPSLPAAEVPAGIAVWPPVQRGDVLRALATGAQTLVIVDGVFHVVPSVSHQELVYALDSGARVLGAASMGALRAAELVAHGMEPVGKIARWYCEGALEGDDEVALLHAPGAEGYRPLTVPLVDVRQALGWRPASTAGPGEAALLAALAELPYGERDRVTLGELATRHLGGPRAAELLSSLANSSLKRDDALAAMTCALEPSQALASREQRGGSRQRPLNGYLGAYLERYLTVPAGASDVSLVEAWAVARLLHPQMPLWIEGQRRRWLAASECPQLSVSSARRDGAVAARAAALVDEHRRTFGRPLLPPAEYRREAEAELATTRRGLDRRLTLESARNGSRGPWDGHDDSWQRELFLAEGDVLPGWWLCRAFSLSPALAPAAALAAAASEVAACFASWSAGRTVAAGELRRLAAELWGCPAEGVGREAARRALLAGEVVGLGLDAALERIVVAERLPRPINDYQQARARLVASELAPIHSPAVAVEGDRILPGGP